MREGFSKRTEKQQTTSHHSMTAGMTTSAAPSVPASPSSSHGNCAAPLRGCCPFAASFASTPSGGRSVFAAAHAFSLNSTPTPVSCTVSSAAPSNIDAMKAASVAGKAGDGSSISPREHSVTPATSLLPPVAAETDKPHLFGGLSIEPKVTALTSGGMSALSSTSPSTPSGGARGGGEGGSGGKRRVRVPQLRFRRKAANDVSYLRLFSKAYGKRGEPVVWCKRKGRPWWPGLLANPDDPNLVPPLPQHVRDKQLAKGHTREAGEIRLLFLCCGTWRYWWTSPKGLKDFRVFYADLAPRVRRLGLFARLAVQHALEECDWRDNADWCPCEKIVSAASLTQEGEDEEEGGWLTENACSSESEDEADGFLEEKDGWWEGRHIPAGAAEAKEPAGAVFSPAGTVVTSTSCTSAKSESVEQPHSGRDAGSAPVSVDGSLTPRRMKCGLGDNTSNVDVMVSGVTPVLEGVTACGSGRMDDQPRGENQRANQNAENHMPSQGLDSRDVPGVSQQKDSSSRLPLRTFGGAQGPSTPDGQSQGSISSLWDITGGTSLPYTCTRREGNDTGEVESSSLPRLDLTSSRRGDGCGLHDKEPKPEAKEREESPAAETPLSARGDRQRSVSPSDSRPSCRSIRLAGTRAALIVTQQGAIDALERTTAVQTTAASFSWGGCSAAKVGRGRRVPAKKSGTPGTAARMLHPPFSAEPGLEEEEPSDADCAGDLSRAACSKEPGQTRSFEISAARKERTDRMATDNETEDRTVNEAFRSSEGSRKEGAFLSAEDPGHVSSPSVGATASFGVMASASALEPRSTTAVTPQPSACSQRSRSTGESSTTPVTSQPHTDDSLGPTSSCEALPQVDTARCVVSACSSGAENPSESHLAISAAAVKRVPRRLEDLALQERDAPAARKDTTDPCRETPATHDLQSPRNVSFSFGQGSEKGDVPTDLSSSSWSETVWHRLRRQAEAAAKKETRAGGQSPSSLSRTNLNTDLSAVPDPVSSPAAAALPSTSEIERKKGNISSVVTAGSSEEVIRDCQVLSPVSSLPSGEKQSPLSSSLAGSRSSSNVPPSSGTIPSYATILKATESMPTATPTPVPTYGTILEKNNSSSFADSRQPAHVRAAFAAGAAAIAMAAAAAASAQAEKDQKRKGGNVSQGVTKSDKKAAVDGAGFFQTRGETEAASSEGRDRNAGVITGENKDVGGNCTGDTASHELPRTSKGGVDNITGPGEGTRAGLGPQSGMAPSEVVAKAVAAAAEVTARVLGGAEGDGGENVQAGKEKEENCSETNRGEPAKHDKREEEQEKKSYISRRSGGSGMPNRGNRRRGGLEHDTAQQGRARRWSRSMATVADSSSGDSRSRSRARQSVSGRGSSRRRRRSGRFRSKRRSHSPSVSRSVSSCSLSPPQSLLARQRARRRSARGLPISKRRRRGSFSSRRSSLYSSRSRPPSSSSSRSSSRSMSRSRGRARHFRRSKQHPRPRRRAGTSSSSPGRDRSPRRRWSSSSRSRVSAGRGLESSVSPPPSRRAGRYNSRDWRGRGRRGRRSSPPYSPFSSSVRRRSPSAPDGYSSRWRFADRGGPGRSHWRGGPWQSDYNGARRGGPSPFRETFGRGGGRRTARDSSRSRSSSSSPPFRGIGSRGRKSGGRMNWYPEAPGGGRRGRRGNSEEEEISNERSRDKRDGGNKGSTSGRSSSSERSPDSLSPSTPFSEKKRWDRKRSRRGGPQRSDADQASSSSFSVTPKTTREEEKEQKGQEKSFQIQEPVAAAKIPYGLVEGETSPETSSKSVLSSQDAVSGQADEKTGKGSSSHRRESAAAEADADRPAPPSSVITVNPLEPSNTCRSMVPASCSQAEQASDPLGSAGAGNEANTREAVASAAVCGEASSEMPAPPSVCAVQATLDPESLPSDRGKVDASQIFASGPGSACESAERSVSFLSEEEVPQAEPFPVGSCASVGGGAPPAASSGEVTGLGADGTAGSTLADDAAGPGSSAQPRDHHSAIHSVAYACRPASPDPDCPASLSEPSGSSGLGIRLQHEGGEEKEEGTRESRSTHRSFSAHSEAPGRGRSSRREKLFGMKEDCSSVKQGGTQHYMYAGKHRLPSTEDEDENDDEGKVFSRSSRSGSFSSRLSPSSSPAATRENAGESCNGVRRGTRGRGGREGRRDTPGWDTERKEGSRKLSGSKQRRSSRKRPRIVSSNSSCEFEQSLSPPTRGGQSSRRFLDPGELSSRSRGTPLQRGLSSRSEQPPYRMTTSEYRDYAARRVRDLHAKGRCVPCRYFWRRYGCKHGDLCKFCHDRSHDGSMLGLDEPAGDRLLAYSGESDLGGGRRSAVSSAKGSGGRDRHVRRDRSCSSSVSRPSSCRVRDRRSRRREEDRGRGGRRGGLTKQGREGDIGGEAFGCSDRMGNRRRGQGLEEVDDDTPGRWVDQTQSSDEEGAKEDEVQELSVSRDEKAPVISEEGKAEPSVLGLTGSLTGRESKEPGAVGGVAGQEKKGLAPSGLALGCIG